MAEKLTPPSKKVAKADGLKNGSANTTTTTPNFDNPIRVWSDGEATKGSKDKIM